MAFIYTVTFRSDIPDAGANFLKLQLVAADQVKALTLATEKAAELQLKVTRLEEIEWLQVVPNSLNMFFQNGKEYSLPNEL